MSTTPSSQELQANTNKTTPMIIFIKGRLDTLNYLIDYMASNTSNNHILNFWDEQFISELLSLDSCIDENTYVIIINNVGLDVCSIGQGNYWDIKQVHLYNIQVDSPIWYKQILDLNLKCMTIVSVDKNHSRFIQQYFPSYNSVFLPHGGILSNHATIPYESRDIDILYVGSKEPLTLPQANLSFFSDNGIEFLQTTYNLLIKYPLLSPEQLVELYFQEAGIPLSTNTDNYISALYALYIYNVRNVRSYYQEKIMSTLAKAHFHVTIYGSNWQSFKEQHPEYAEYLHINDRITPQHCIEMICHSKITLNLQPWFREGAHERIYNAMLNESVCITDTSEYLKRHFQDGKNILFYSLSNLEELVEKSRKILEEPEYAKYIIQNQKQTVIHSTWHDRLNNILNQQFTEGQDFI